MDTVAGHGQLEQLSTKAELAKRKSDEKYTNTRYSMIERGPSHNGFFNSPGSDVREEEDVDFARYAEAEMSVDDLESVLDSPELQKKARMNPLERISSLQGSGRETLSDDDLEPTIVRGEPSFKKAADVAEGEHIEQKLIEKDISAAIVKAVPNESAVERLREDSAVVSHSSGADGQHAICKASSGAWLENEGNASGANGYQDHWSPVKESLFEERRTQSEAHVEPEEELDQSVDAAAERKNIEEVTPVLVSTLEEGTTESKGPLNPAAREPRSHAEMESNNQTEDALGSSETIDAEALEEDRLYEEIVRELDGIKQIKTGLADEKLFDCVLGDRCSSKPTKYATPSRDTRFEKANKLPESCLEDAKKDEPGCDHKEKSDQKVYSKVVSENISTVTPAEETDKDGEGILSGGPLRGVPPSTSQSGDEEDGSQEGTVAGINESIVVDTTELDKGKGGLLSDSIVASERHKVESPRMFIEEGRNSPEKMGTEKRGSPRKEGDNSRYTRDVPTALNGFTVPEAPLLRTSMRARRVLQSSVEQDEKHSRISREAAIRTTANSSVQNSRYLTVPKSPFLTTRRRVEKTTTPPKIPMKTSQPPKPRESSVTVPKTPALVSHTRSRNANLRSYESMQLESIQLAKRRFQELRARTQTSYERVIANDTAVPRKAPPTRPLTASRTPNFRTSKRAAERTGFRSDRESSELQIVSRQGTRPESKPKQAVEKRTGVRMPITAAKTPNLHTRSRAAARQTEEAPAQKVNQLPFKQRTVQPQILTILMQIFDLQIEQDTRAKPRRRWTGHTVANPPRLSQSLSYRKVEAPETSEAPSRKHKARPMPRYRQSEMIPKVAPKVTSPEPFRLSETNHRKPVGREEDSPKRGFRARKVPNVKKELPSVKARPATVPTPFNLISEELHKLSKDSFESHIDQEEAEKRDKRCFHARPLPDLNKVWKPEIQTRNTENLLPVTLHSDKRAAGRLEREEYKLAQEEEQAAYREKLLLEQQRREEHELAEYRKSLVFKARPVMFK
ncbi:hypothetical protein NDN08_007476 [Rhodosorus marinus]|uniref:TPX2 C-terminal domain-containing protein n=1 Tax=Rhodosorus marinus TaxID=101924 RepID=A0AAV8V2E7_9RHOD|nr:hypothetical protein NDN08_007476 [Rhodosorus marinus]